MKFSEILRQLRAEHNLLQSDICDYMAEHGASITQRTVSNWETDRSKPTIEQFLLLCTLYNIHDVLAVFGGRQGMLSSLNAAGKRRVYEYIRLLQADAAFAAAPCEEKKRIVRPIPLYDLPVSAGTGQFLDSEAYEIIEVDETVPLSATFAVRVSGDSMLPRLHDRQTVYVKQQQTILPGEIGIFVVNGDAFCKVFGSVGKQAALLSLNQNYKPRIITGNDAFRVLGKVVG